FLVPTVQKQWSPRAVEQVGALTGHTTSPEPVTLPPPLLPSPPPLASEPASPVAPVLPTPALVPPSLPLEIDVDLAQTLWRTKIQAEEHGAPARLGAVTPWETMVTNTAKGLGLDVLTWQASIWQLPGLTRPCFIEVLPESPAARPGLWVLV